MSSSSSSSMSEDSHEPLKKQAKRDEEMKNIPETPLNLTRLKKDLASSDTMFFEMFGINRDNFATLENMIQENMPEELPLPVKMKPIPKKDQIAMSMRFLASGLSLDYFSNNYNINRTILAYIIKQVCKAIVKKLKPIAMPRPTKQMWKDIAAGFMEAHHIPNCIGSLNGRVLLGIAPDYLHVAIVDSRHKFVMIDVGKYKDAAYPERTWGNTKLSKRFEANKLNVPESRKVLPHFDALPYVLVGGLSFPSNSYIISQYKHKDPGTLEAKQVFNARIEPVRQLWDDTYTNYRRRWNAVQGAVPVPPDMLECILYATCCLENFFPVPPMIPVPHAHVSASAEKIEAIRASIPRHPTFSRQKFFQYFLSPQGQVSWQYASLNTDDEHEDSEDEDDDDD